VEIEDRVAVFTEPLAAAFRLTEQLTLTPQTKVAVQGDGKLGLLCAWVLRGTGVQVTLVGKHEDKLRLAGANITTMFAAQAADGGRVFDIVVEASGSPGGLSDAFRIVR